MSAATYDLNIDAGATYKLVLKAKTSTAPDAPAFDLTDWTPRMQVRRDADALGVLLDCSASNGRISVSDAAAGEITLNIPAVDTSRIPSASGVYDLIITNAGSGEVRRLLQGAVKVSPAITR